MDAATLITNVISQSGTDASRATVLSLLNEHGLCECGCGERAPLAKQTRTAEGYVKGQPMRFVSGHGRKQTHAGMAKGWDVDPSTGCWLSNKAIGVHGYTVDWQYGTEYRRRYVEKYGKPPTGYDLHHRCENRRCVNPDHLEAITRAEHRNRHAKTTPEQRVEIATRANAGESAASIAADFGIKKGLVHTYAYKQRKGLL